MLVTYVSMERKAVFLRDSYDFSAFNSYKSSHSHKHVLLMHDKIGAATLTHLRLAGSFTMLVAH